MYNWYNLRGWPGESELLITAAEQSPVHISTGRKFRASCQEVASWFLSSLYTIQARVNKKKIAHNRLWIIIHLLKKNIK